MSPVSTASQGVGNTIVSGPSEVITKVLYLPLASIRICLDPNAGTSSQPGGISVSPESRIIRAGELVFTRTGIVKPAVASFDGYC